MLQAATRAMLIKEQHFLVERTSALVVRLAARGKILLGKEDLPKSATTPSRRRDGVLIFGSWQIQYNHAAWGAVCRPDRGRH